MPYHRDTYFAAVRASLFNGSLTQEQVDGQNAILGVWEYQTDMTDQRHLAYMLSTCFHETATRCWPIEEYGKGSGHSYGETDPETGQAYFGRGLVQLTWRDNYARATAELDLTGDRDIEWHAERALDVVVASRIMFRGMAQGWFTGKQLSDYFNANEEDPVNARQIINGNDQDDLIAGYYDEFMDALDQSFSESLDPSTLLARIKGLEAEVDRVTILLEECQQGALK
jgi:putative chitinase